MKTSGSRSAAPSRDLSLRKRLQPSGASAHARPPGSPSGSRAKRGREGRFRLQGRKAPAPAVLRSGRAYLASSLPDLYAGGRGRRRGTLEGSEGAGVAGGKERTGERRPERSEGGKMADRFSRFNEDRDFQVNTGVAEVRGRRWPSRNLLIPRSQLAFSPGSAPASETAPFSPSSDSSRGLPV